MNIEAKLNNQDDKTLKKINEKFATMVKMSGSVDGMVVSGPPGIGKTYGIADQLQKLNLNAQFVKGTMSPIGLFVKLWETRAKNFVLVIDDCDSILYTLEGLSLLKAALDSGKRTVTWAKQNNKLDEMGIPNTFDFEGKIVFITNLDFRQVTNKRLKGDLDAVRSRCFYLQMNVHSKWDRFLRTRYVIQQGILSKSLSQKSVNEVMAFYEHHLDALREISVRSFLKVVDLYKKFPTDWEYMARHSMFQHEGESK
jgi:hypothetical protein